MDHSEGRERVGPRKGKIDIKRETRSRGGERKVSDSQKMNPGRSNSKRPKHPGDP